MRAFIAVEIDEQLKQKISKLISNLKKSGADAKWITENQMHITLKFLGNISKDKIGEISDALSIVSSDFKSFKITFSKIGAFPNLDHPRIIWLGIDDNGAESLKMLNKNLENTLKKSGFREEDHSFQPHLTLARIKSGRNISGLVKLIKETDFASGNYTQINKLTLFQSTLNPGGTIYTVISEKYLQDTSGITG